MTEEFHIQTGYIALRSIDAAIHHFEVLHFVGDEVGEIFIVDFGSEFERAIDGAESVVATGDDLETALRLDIAIERDNRVALGIGGGVAIFLVERSLVV